MVETDDDDFLTVERWPRGVFQAHYHEEFNWLVVTRPGRVAMDVEGRELVLDVNRWLCVFPWTAHTVRHVSDDCEVLSLFVPAALMRDAAREMEIAAPFVPRYIVGTEGLIAQGLALAWGERRFGSRERDSADDALSQLVPRWLWRSYRSSIELAPTWALRLRLRLGPDGEALASFIEAHLADTPFPWDGLAAALSVSRRSLQRRVFDALGASPSRVVAGMRLDRARELLAEIGRPLADIALACGFSSQSHFSTAFKAEHGVSPLQYRASLSLGDKTLSRA